MHPMIEVSDKNNSLQQDKQIYEWQAFLKSLEVYHHDFLYNL